jgi:hypothetical protein
MPPSAEHSSMASAARRAAFLLPLIGFVVLSVTLGMYVATILYLVFTMRFQGGYGWLASLATAIGTAAFFYLALEKFFQIGLLKGPLEAADRPVMPAARPGAAPWITSPT